MSRTRVVIVPASRPISACRIAVPERFLNFRSCSARSADPRYAASHPHGWSAVSRITANGIDACRFAAKYQASGGTSYSASIHPDGSRTQGAGSISVTRSRKQSGGPGSLAIRLSASNTE